MSRAADSAAARNHPRTTTAVVSCRSLPAGVCRPADSHKKQMRYSGTIASASTGELRQITNNFVTTNEQQPNKEKKPRRSVYSRRVGDLPPLQLTERDRSVLELVRELRVPTAEQIHRVLFAPAGPKPCGRRLQKLWLHGYLDRVFPQHILWDGHTPRLRPELYYLLTAKGAEEISPGSLTPPSGDTAPSLMHLRHFRDVNEFRTSLTAALRERFGQDHRLTWLKESRLRERIVQAKRKDASLRLKGLIVSDALFSFVLPSGNREFFFLEVDRGTETSWRLVQRAKNYVRFYRSGLCSSLHGVPSFRVLFFTTSLHRLMHLRARIASIGDCLNMFWFTTFEEKAPKTEPIPNITPQRILTPIWRKITDSDLHSLVPRHPAPREASIVERPPSEPQDATADNHAEGQPPTTPESSLSDASAQNSQQI